MRLLSAYTASKHGIVGLTKNAAVEYANHGIRVNARLPRRDHDAADVQRVARAPGGDPAPAGDDAASATRAEVAAAVVWLCSDDASFVTGVAMPVDAGSVAGW